MPYHKRPRGTWMQDISTFGARAESVKVVAYGEVSSEDPSSARSVAEKSTGSLPCRPFPFRQTKILMKKRPSRLLFLNAGVRRTRTNWGTTTVLRAVNIIIIIINVSGVSRENSDAKAQHHTFLTRPNARRQPVSWAWTT